MKGKFFCHCFDAVFCDDCFKEIFWNWKFEDWDFHGWKLRFWLLPVNLRSKDKKLYWRWDEYRILLPFPTQILRISSSTSLKTKAPVIKFFSIVFLSKSSLESLLAPLKQWNFSCILPFQSTVSLNNSQKLWDTDFLVSKTRKNKDKCWLHSSKQSI